MAVLITDLCINCDACIDECPATAIVSADDSPLAAGELTYVKPEKCIECVDAAVPKCADICPTEGCIVWDMPYTETYDDYFVQSNDYVIRVHKKKGLLSPLVAPRPFRESISMQDRAAHVSVGETLKLYSP
ncbi:4Fe-4S dicluster domain-containing protein [Sulfurimonas sp. HSL3-7]|uniref:4Fe-4S dicluster domain-containing protein n=1 Tax=Sulfonitrofixus jiaomeiensis TaxID=3131938 RepID=UPI0031F7E9DF